LAAPFESSRSASNDNICPVGFEDIFASGNGEESPDFNYDGLTRIRTTSDWRETIMLK
jgi:hypothetical protein